MWEPMLPEEKCPCPFCGYSRKHKPPECHCFICRDGALASVPLPRKPLRIKVMEWPAEFPGKDVADLLNTPGGDVMFQAMINLARPHLLWIIDRLEDQFDLSTPDGASEAADFLVEPLLKQHPVARARYVTALAEALKVPEDTIRRMLNQKFKERKPNPQRRKG